MRDIPGLPPGSILGYCTNVHAGATLDEVKKNVEQYSLRVKRLISPANAMGVGLWLAQSSMLEALEPNAAKQLKSWLAKRELIPFTFNGFPFQNFHQPIVKHAVYEPSWDDESRAGYSIALAKILADLSTAGDERSISTVPIRWHDSTNRYVEKAVFNLHMVASVLDNLYSSTGVLLHLDLEPEPGCVLQRSDDVVRFFELLLRDADEEQILKHIRVCHDICHAAVMFEDQAEMIARYRAAGIQIGKVQISNAIRVDLRNLSARERVEALAQLRQFREDRYLHQTMIHDGDQFRFFDDLPKALADFGSTDRAGDEWRVHFHVPVYLEEFGLLKTTRDYILECMRLLKDSEVKHWEVETYAWNVLPKELQVPDLAEGIAKELLWVKVQAATIA